MTDEPREMWLFYPLYGLAIEDDPGMVDPIWGDATLVSCENAEELIRDQPVSQRQMLRQLWLSGLISTPKMRDLDAEFVEAAYPASDEHLDDRKPHSFVTVRQTVAPDDLKDAFDELRPRAESITALLGLSLTYFGPTRGIPALGFDSRPVPVRGQFAVDDEGIVQRSIRRHTHTTGRTEPLKTSKDRIRESFEDGTSIDVVDEELDSWTISKTNPVVSALSRRRGTKFQQVLKNASRTLYRTYHRPRPSTQVVQCATVIEILMASGDTPWSKLKTRAKFVLGSNWLEEKRPKIVNAVLNARNRAVHQGESASGVRANDALLVSSELLFRTAEYGVSFDSHLKFTKWLDFADGEGASKSDWDVDSIESFKDLPSSS